MDSRITGYMPVNHNLNNLILHS